jgi:hypothetical protein
MGDFWWSYNQGPGLALDARFHGIKDAEGTTHRLIIAETANGSTSFDQFISEEGAKGYQWFKQSANTVYDYGSNSVEQFDRVYNQTGATRYPVVDIEPPYVNAPHYKDQQNQKLRERNYSTFIRGGAGINFGHEKWWPTFPDDMPSQFLDHLICRDRLTVWTPIACRHHALDGAAPASRACARAARAHRAARTERWSICRRPGALEARR